MTYKNKLIKAGSTFLFSSMLLTSIMPVVALGAEVSTSDVDTVSSEEANEQEVVEESVVETEVESDNEVAETPNVDNDTQVEVPTEETTTDESTTEESTEETNTTDTNSSTDTSSTTDSSSSSSSNNNNNSSSTQDSSTTSSSTSASTSGSSSASNNASQTDSSGTTTSSTGEVSTSDNSIVSSSIGSNSLTIQTSVTGEEFIESIAKEAARVANNNQLYASVMIAQACLETGYGASSLSQAPYYNVFGIKGSYNGNSVSLNTYEDNGSGSMYLTTADFRSYNSYTEAFEDYAQLLRTFSSNFYSGVWRENTSSYLQATAFLTGRYATDTEYNVKLNAIIKAYDLTQYDADYYLEESTEDVTIELEEEMTLAEVAQEVDVEESLLAEYNQVEADETIEASTEIIIGQKAVYRMVSYGVTSTDFTIPLPIDSYVVTSPYGEREDPTGSSGTFHNGIDLAANTGTEVFASKSGVVVASGYSSSAGNYVIIQHEDGLYSSYFHLNTLGATAGTEVSTGDVIGEVGTTGNSTGPHLHFAISTDVWAGYENPEDYLDF